jgi:hypothetical protein
MMMTFLRRAAFGSRLALPRRLEIRHRFLKILLGGDALFDLLVETRQEQAKETDRAR